MVIAGESFVQAVELFARYVGTIRAVLLDLTMPRMGGAEVMAAVRRIRPDVPVERSEPAWVDCSVTLALA